MSADVTPVTDFLLARIAEEEAAIAAADSVPRHRASDRRALRGCQARRAIVTLCSADDAPIHCLIILGLMALPYTDHPEYRNFWGVGLDLMTHRS